MRLYLAGPIAGMPTFEAAQANFTEAARRLVAAGYDTVNPIDVEPQCDKSCVGERERDFHDHARSCYMKWDLIAMLQCDGVAMIPGWDNSIGANKEREVARHCGMPVMLESVWIERYREWLK